jgi:hypothetical protein
MNGETGIGALTDHFMQLQILPVYSRTTKRGSLHAPVFVESHNQMNK